MNRSTTFAIPMKRHELADYLMMPRPSLSRELGLMRDEKSLSSMVLQSK
jgi:hypothetical protein